MDCGLIRSGAYTQLPPGDVGFCRGAWFWCIRARCNGVSGNGAAQRSGVLHSTIPTLITGLFHSIDVICAHVTPTVFAHGKSHSEHTLSTSDVHTSVPNRHTGGAHVVHTVPISLGDGSAIRRLSSMNPQLIHSLYTQAIPTLRTGIPHG